MEHRGAVNQQRARISIGVGHGPELTAMVAPASALVDEKSKHLYRPIMYKDYIRWQQSITTRGKDALQAIINK